MMKMKGIIEFEDLEKHIADIFSSSALQNLTLEQAKSVSLLMEMSYRKGKSESNEGQNSITNCTVNVKVDCNSDDIKEKVNKVLSDVFEDLSKTINIGVSY